MIKLIECCPSSVFDAAVVLGSCWNPAAAPAAAVSGSHQEKTTTSQGASSFHPQSKCVLTNFRQLFIRLFDYILTLFSLTCVSVVDQVGNAYQWGDSEGDEDDAQDYVNVDLMDTNVKMKGGAAGVDEEGSNDYEEPVCNDDHDYKKAGPNCMKARKAYVSVSDHREDEDDVTSDEEDNYENVSPPLQSVVNKKEETSDEEDNYENVSPPSLYASPPPPPPPGVDNDGEEETSDEEDNYENVSPPSLGVHNDEEEESSDDEQDNYENVS